MTLSEYLYHFNNKELFYYSSTNICSGTSICLIYLNDIKRVLVIALIMIFYLNNVFIFVVRYSRLSSLRAKRRCQTAQVQVWVGAGMLL